VGHTALPGQLLVTAVDRFQIEVHVVNLLANRCGSRTRNVSGDVDIYFSVFHLALHGDSECTSDVRGANRIRKFLVKESGVEIRNIMTAGDPGLPGTIEGRSAFLCDTYLTL
jgi:hypothetical protein